MIQIFHIHLAIFVRAHSYDKKTDGWMKLGQHILHLHTVYHAVKIHTSHGNKFNQAKSEYKHVLADISHSRYVVMAM